MFGMIPFDRDDDNFFSIFDNFERKFFGNSNASLPAFRTDIRDAGDRFVPTASSWRRSCPASRKRTSSWT